MNIKLVATDMDGTLLNSQKEMPEDFIDWVRSHSEIMTVIASGRQYYKLEEDFQEIRDELIFIAENGGLIFKRGEIIYCDEMPQDKILDCLDRVDKVPIAKAIVCGADSAYIENPTDEEYENGSMYFAKLMKCEDIRKVMDQDRIVKVAVFIKQKRAEEMMKHFSDLGEDLSVVLSGDSWIDIANASVNKGAAVESIQRKYGIDRSECMAFGDYLNDYTLIESCEESYCMDNGHEQLKEIAKYIADSNDNDGVMKVLRKI